MTTSKEHHVLFIFAFIVSHCVANLPLEVVEGQIGELGVTFDPETETTFYLFTQSNKETPQVLKLNDFSSVENSYFRSSRPTRVIIPGWTNNVSSLVIQFIKPAYLESADVNVIVVDWYGGSRAIYTQAMEYVPPVGQVTAQFLKFLSSTAGLSIDDVYIIGHSLGAHCAGFAGKYMQSLFSKFIPVIFALDPGQPLYYLSSSAQTVAKTDARYVQVIHTNVGVFGYIWPVGHADFYVNGGGPVQLSCANNTDLFCSHHLAFEVFAESLTTSVGFFGKKCTFNIVNDVLGLICLGSKKMKMGGDSLNESGNGIFNVPTNMESPYAKGNV